jgi:hypothetical protein
MKIILTESQIKSLKEIILSESTDDKFTYTTKNEQKLTGYVGKVLNPFDYIIVPAGTKFRYNFTNGTIDAWKGKLKYKCGKGMETSNNNRYSDKNLLKALDNKFCDGTNIKSELVNLKQVKDIETDLGKSQDMNCVNNLKPLYNNAITWWKNKLNEPAFYSKLKRLNNYTDQQTKEWISKYKNYLYNNISGPFCPKQHTPTYNKLFSKTEPKGESPNAVAFLAGPAGRSRVVVNSYYFVNNEDMVATLVHEIQHALYDLKPMTPDVNWKKVFPYKVWVGNENEGQSNTETPTEKSTISKYGLKQTDIDWWKDRLKDETDSKDPSNDVGYVCRITELASRVVSMKNLLGYSTEQKITVSDFKKFIVSETVPYNDENAYFIVLCWLNNGMPDIQTFLDNLDKYVVAKVEPSNNDDIKDQQT